MSDPENRLTTMTSDEFVAALRDLEGLARSSGLTSDDIMDQYHSRLDELEDDA